MLVGILIALRIFNAFAQENISSPNQKSKSRTLKGRVLDKETTQPLLGTNIIIMGTMLGGSTDLNGNYVISNLSPGEYTLEFSYIGYQTERIERVKIYADSSVELDLKLQPQPLQLSEMIVTPSQFVVMGKQPSVRQTLTKQQLETIPFGEDIYRAITRLPGVSSSDFSAKFTVRGGKNEEILALMDGQELYEPFHLKDVEGGVLSIVDVEAIEGIDLFTGGYPAEYGECLSGVFNMKSTSARRELSRTTLGISFMNARFMSEGNFREEKGSWLISARRGYLDLVLDLMGEENQPQPVYYDVFGKLRFNLSEKNNLSGNILYSDDKMKFTEDDKDEDDTKYGNYYGWLTLNSIRNSKLYLRTIGSFGRITHHRQGIGYFGDLSAVNNTVNDKNRANLFSLKQDWDYELNSRWFLKWGFYYNYQSAVYDYINTVTTRIWMDPYTYILVRDSTMANLRPSGNRYGGYFSNRFQIDRPLTIEIGLRYDGNEFTNDWHFSPRFNVVYSLGKRTFLRGGWGYFRQSQRIYEIKVAYGETDFFPAQFSQHWVAGLEHFFNNGLNFRVETYYKKVSDLRSDHRNASNDIEIFPEVQDDVFSLTFNDANASGVELYMKYDQGGKFSIWTSYALAYAEEDVRNLIYRGESFILDDPIIPNRYDQRHTFFLDVNYRPNRNWRFNFSWQFHTGWPYSRQILRSRELPDGRTEYYSEYDQLYGSNFPPYHRLDIQFNRHFYFSQSRISIFLAVINLYNRDNVRNIKYNWRFSSDAIPYLEEEKEFWFPLLPSLGISWTWTN
jgi:outer membrane receptor for ferrienterochelin and colicin